MSDIDEYDCGAVFKRLDDFLDRELAPDEVALVQVHLDICEVCAREHRFESSVLDAIRGKLAQVRAPQALLDRIRAALDEDRHRA